MGQLANKDYTIDVVDDDEAMRESLVTLLEDAGYRVRAHASAEELLAISADSQTDCVVSDVHLPGMNGVSLLRRLGVARPSVPLVLITGHGDLPSAVAAMKAGAVDFLEKPFEAADLLDAVEAGLKARRPGGHETVDVELARQRLDTLTPREHEVLMHLVAGDSNKVVAAKIGVSPRTVEFHRAHIMDKVGASGLADLVRLWFTAQRTP